MRTQLEIDWEEKYGGMTEEEYEGTVKGMVNSKLSEYRTKEDEAVPEKKSLTYPQIVKAIPEALKRIEKYKDMPQKLWKEKKKALNKEFDTELKFERVGGAGANRELWVGERLVRWAITDPEYLQAKAEQARSTNDYSEYVALKEKWEKDHDDIIQAEKARSARAELMQADPETLRILGITPDPTYTAPSTEVSPNVSDGSYFHLEQGYVDAIIRARASDMIAEQKKASEG